VSNWKNKKNLLPDAENMVFVFFQIGKRVYFYGTFPQKKNSAKKNLGKNF